ncbi:MAG TPA: LysM peptidoglycan-binding domain-containing protein [Coxiellaceae bacterium]|nr:LysM peptidoglycan-binding domain-containing protein [Coxiellaceae bacterium]
MHAKKFFTLFFILLMQVGEGYIPPPPAFNRPPQNEDIQSILKQLRTNVMDLKNEVRNHETEIRMFEERLHNQENANEHMRQQLSDDFQTQKDFSRATLVNLQSKIDGLEKRLANAESQFTSLNQTSNSLKSDLRQNVSQINDAAVLLSQYKQKMQDLENQLNLQNQHIANLEVALQSLVEIIQIKDTPSSSPSSTGTTTYKVQPGDTLEKIARNHKVTIQQLKDYNQLNNDRIIVGQTLKIP